LGQGEVTQRKKGTSGLTDPNQMEKLSTNKRGRKRDQGTLGKNW